jgi:hypothetical protein
MSTPEQSMLAHLTEGVRVISDGTQEGTHVYLDGVPLKGVTEVVWKMNRRERTAQVTIELKDVHADVAAGAPQFRTA